jgi:hypothetical protein
MFVVVPSEAPGGLRALRSAGGTPAATATGALCLSTLSGNNSVTNSSRNRGNLWPAYTRRRVYD